MAKPTVANDAPAMEAPTNPVLTIRERRGTKQTLPQAAVTPPTSSPNSSVPSTPSTLKASNSARNTRPRQGLTPPLTDPKYRVPPTPVVPKPITPRTLFPETAAPKPMTPQTTTSNPAIPKPAHDTEADTIARMMNRERALNAQIVDLKRQIIQQDDQIRWLKVQVQKHVARQLFG